MRRIFTRNLPVWSLLIWASLVLATSCRHDDIVYPSRSFAVGWPEWTDISGFYLLNEGNMGSNSATLDYYDFTAGTYRRNIYPEMNPTVVKELGDVGNDIAIYGSKLYAVINCSHKVEVMEAENAKRITHIDIPNCRYIVFDKGYAYVSSYVGPVQISPMAPKGAVFKVDTTTLKVVGTVEVGYQPEEMAIRFGKLYVANSGGYRAPNYDNTVSVIDLESFKEVRKIEAGINLHRLKGDKRGYLYVSSRGDYYDVPSCLYVIDAWTDRVVEKLDLGVSDFCISGDSAYLYSTEWNHQTGQNVITYGILDLKERKLVSRNFISDGTEKKIKIPYGIAIHPITKDIYVTDAKSYVIPGTLYCFNNDGHLKWKVTTGEIPAHFAFKGSFEDKIYDHEE